MNREEQIKMWEQAARREFRFDVPHTPSGLGVEKTKKILSKGPPPHQGGIHPESPLGQDLIAGKSFGTQKRRP